MLDPTCLYRFDFVPSAGFLVAMEKILFLSQFSTFRATKGTICFVDVGNVTEVIFVAS